MCTRAVPLIVALAVLLVVACGEAALAQLDIRDAIIASPKGQSRGTLTVALHFSLSPKWLDPQEQDPTSVPQQFSYLFHDALIKPMPQGYFSYSLAESLEMPVDYTSARFRLRRGVGGQGVK